VSRTLRSRARERAARTGGRARAAGGAQGPPGKGARPWVGAGQSGARRGGDRAQGARRGGVARRAPRGRARTPPSARREPRGACREGEEEGEGRERGLTLGSKIRR
jgi:hypothetical protein